MSRSCGNEFDVTTRMPPVATHQMPIRAAIQSLPLPKHEGTAVFGLSRTDSAICAWIVHGRSPMMSVMKPTGSVA